MLQGILHNRYVLYVLVALVFFNMVFHALSGNLVTPAIFALVTIVTSFFTKNMVIILLVGLVLANLALQNTRKNPWSIDTKTNTKENMANPGDDEADQENVDEPVAADKALNVENPRGKVRGKSRIAEERKRDFGFMRQKYDELLKVQNSLMSNMGNLEGSLENMDTIVEDVKNHVESIRQNVRDPTTK